MKYAIAILVILAACVSPTPNPPPVTADCAGYCQRLRDVGCPEGSDSSCTRVCGELAASSQPFSTQCVFDAKSASDVRACGLTCAIVP